MSNLVQDIQSFLTKVKNAPAEKAPAQDDLMVNQPEAVQAGAGGSGIFLLGLAAVGIGMMMKKKDDKKKPAAKKPGVKAKVNTRVKAGAKKPASKPKTKPASKANKAKKGPSGRSKSKVTVKI
jgi:L-asparaginase II